MLTFTVFITDDREHDAEMLLMRITDGVASLVGPDNVVVETTYDDE